MVLFWDQYVGCRFTLLWIYGQSIRTLDGLYRFAGCDYWTCLPTRFFLVVI